MIFGIYVSIGLILLVNCRYALSKINFFSVFDVYMNYKKKIQEKNS